MQKTCSVCFPRRKKINYSSSSISFDTYLCLLMRLRRTLFLQTVKPVQRRPCGFSERPLTVATAPLLCLLVADIVLGATQPAGSVLGTRDCQLQVLFHCLAYLIVSHVFLFCLMKKKKIYNLKCHVIFLFSLKKNKNI